MHRRHLWVELAIGAAFYGCGSPSADLPDAAAPSDGALDDVDPRPLDASRTTFTATPLRGRPAPAWRVTQTWVVSARLGFRAEGMPGLAAFYDLVAAPNHGYAARTMNLAHLRPHDGPYELEVEGALARAGLVPRETFAARENVQPQAIFVVVLLDASPQSPRGRTPDGADRPMIPDAAFPIRFDGAVSRKGGLYNGYMVTDVSVPPVGFAGAWEGRTHVLYAVAGNSEYASANAPAEGLYERFMQIIDAQGRGYHLSVPYRVRCMESDRAVLACRGAFDAGADDASNADDGADGNDAPASREPGRPCEVDGDCGVGGLCIREVGALQFPGGYCTFDCAGPDATSECYRGPGVCVSIDLGRGSAMHCLRRCGDGCRPGYRCLPLAPLFPVCLVP